MPAATKKRPRDVKGRWVKVVAPEVWRPAEGASLVGHYGGTTRREGAYGEYTLAIVHSGRRAFLVRGFDLLNKIGAAGFDPGEPIRIDFCGFKHTHNGHTMKVFDVYYDKSAAPREALPYLHEVKE